MSQSLPSPILHLIKLSVGPESLDDLAGWQALRREQTGEEVNRHLTRNYPRRAQEILEGGGSIYWVIKGVILARQHILAFEARANPQGERRCAIVLDPPLIPTVPRSHRPFQGWRYFQPEAAPPDLEASATDELPPGLAEELRNLGLL
ncbi:MAG TPA: DUF1489 domain-containing protein [Alphaproteobacteria bacterium]|nr:DUF1489 domain-containing protein [Alphaproteobacteria bacterium]